MRNTIFFTLLILFTKVTAVTSIPIIDCYFKNPLFLEQNSSILGELNINYHEFNAIKELEVRERIVQALRSHPQLSKCDRMVLLWLGMELTKAASESDAVNLWRNVAQDHGRSSDSLISYQMDIINLNEGVIKQFYNQAQQLKQKVDSEIAQEILIRILKRHQWHDRNQTTLIPIRSLAILKERKIHIKALKNCKILIKNFYQENPHIPLLEQVKNFKVFHINDFYASKGALIIHDIFDHFWFGIKLEEAGIFKEYDALWRKVGGPHLRDIFSREGELYASIAFDFRSFHMAPVDYHPLLNLEDIKSIFKNSIDNGTFTDNQKYAYNLIMTLPSQAKFLKGLPYIISGMAIEFIESNRKVGFIKVLNDQRQPCGYFNFFDPEHIAFIIEAAYFLFKKHTQYTHMLTSIYLLIEQFLQGIATDEGPDELTVGLQDLEELDKINNNNLSAQKIQWFKRNVGFETVRYEVGE